MLESSDRELMYRTNTAGWTPELVFAARGAADGGNMRLLADLCETILADDRVDGVLQTRTHGLLGLPIKFAGGETTATEILRGKTNQPGEWWHMHDEAELAKLLAWGIVMGVGLAQRVPLPRVAGQLQRYRLQVWSPRWLRYSWMPVEGVHWHVSTQDGERAVVPGDGQWIVFTPYGAERPWAYGKWNALAFPWLLKRFGLEDRANHMQVLGSPLWIGKVGPGSSESQRRKYLAQLRALGRAGRLVLPNDWDMELRESTGNSWQIYSENVSWADKAITVILAGQLVTTEGTSGFSSGNVHDEIKDDLIRFDAVRFSTCLRAQSLEPWALYNFGSRDAAPWPYWDTDKPETASVKADALTKAATAITDLDAALKAHGLRVNIEQMISEFGLQTKPLPATTPTPEPTP